MDRLEPRENAYSTAVAHPMLSQEHSRGPYSGKRHWASRHLREPQQIALELTKLLQRRATVRRTTFSYPVPSHRYSIYGNTRECVVSVASERTTFKFFLISAAWVLRPDSSKVKTNPYRARLTLLGSIGILKSNVGFDYAKRLEDCHCEGKARSNLQPSKTEIASSLHFSQ